MHKLETNIEKPTAKTKSKAKYTKVLDISKHAREKAGIAGVGKAWSAQQ